MKVNRILFGKLKVQHELLKMKSAYILAERAIIGDPSMTGWQKNEGEEIDFGPGSWDRPDDDGDWAAGKQWTPASQHEAMDHFKNVNENNKLINKMKHLEEQGRLALEEENYEKLAVLKEVYDILKNKLNKL